MSAGRPKGVQQYGHRHYEIIGAKCSCGGQMLAEASGSRGAFEWELYCDKCLDADPNGYATLRECVQEAKTWAERQSK